jgi:hypothetical protein
LEKALVERKMAATIASNPKFLTSGTKAKDGFDENDLNLLTIPFNEKMKIQTPKSCKYHH